MKKTPAERTQMMRAFKKCDTLPELTLRRIAHRLGYRFRLHRTDLPGTPDLVFPAHRKIIFVNGCFWHSHGCKLTRLPSSNLAYWAPKQPGYAVSLSRRWLIEKGFGWLKQTGPLRQVKLRGLEKVDWLFVFSCAAHNLIRLPKLMAQQPGRLMEQCA